MALARGGWVGLGEQGCFKKDRRKVWSAVKTYGKGKVQQEGRRMDRRRKKKEKGKERGEIREKEAERGLLAAVQLITGDCGYSGNPDALFISRKASSCRSIPI